MGAPTSAILAEIFIQYLEHIDILKLLQKHHILDYYRYVDDILIIYYENYTNIDNTLADFNAIHFNIQYTIETQTDNKINYLDITIENKNNTFTFDIYRKPTATDIIIHNCSFHPTEHKHSAISYIVNRMKTYPISIGNKHKEAQLINTILHNNRYSSQEFIQNKRQKTTNTTLNQKWITFTYIGNQTRAIARLFKNTNLHIAYKTSNTFNLRTTTLTNIIVVAYLLYI
jgi:hypothetical protein